MPPPLDRRKVIEPGEQLAAALQPVVHERKLQLGDGRSFDADHGLAPVILRVRIAEPYVGDSDTAGKPDCPIDDHQLAMRPMIHSRDRVPAQWVIPLEINSIP